MGIAFRNGKKLWTSHNLEAKSSIYTDLGIRHVREAAKPASLVNRHGQEGSYR